MRKDKVNELFKELLIDKTSGTNQDTNIAKFIAFKFRHKQKQLKYSRLNMIINSGMIRGPRYIEALLMKIRMGKEMFLIELELGNEILIPVDISQDQYPNSFRYYDSILQLIQLNAHT